MRVALVVYGDLEQRSGGNLYDGFLVAQLENQGHDVEVVGIEGISRCYLGEALRGWRGKALTETQRQALARCDLIVEDELIHPSLFAQADLAENEYLAVPRVCLVHHLRSSEDRGAFENALAAGIERRYLLGFESFLFNSKTTRRSVAELIGDEALDERCSAIAYPGGDRLPVAKALQLRAEQHPTLETCLLARTSDPEAPLRILFVGNLIARKGLHRLLDALASETAFEWLLDVVGGDHHESAYAQSQRARSDFEPALEGRVRWHGPLDDVQLAALLLESHCLCVPSSWEGFGIVYAEAQAFGVPVIASASGATWEIVETGVTGFLVDPMSSSAIRDACESLAQDRGLLKQMSYDCLTRSEQRPTWEESMAGAVQYLESVAQVAS